MGRRVHDGDDAKVELHGGMRVPACVEDRVRVIRRVSESL